MSFALSRFFSPLLSYYSAGYPNPGWRGARINPEPAQRSLLTSFASDVGVVIKSNQRRRRFRTGNDDAVKTRVLPAEMERKQDVVSGLVLRKKENPEDIDHHRRDVQHLSPSFTIPRSRKIESASLNLGDCLIVKLPHRRSKESRAKSAVKTDVDRTCARASERVIRPYIRFE
ncbi:Hypothetical protein NTJ_01012 [Nesidiocoris tenuis]|uniref:Uncharacterized protein n=1 Tax=Nesidiocoris tenuis TaxID=355587 RepID=A0ABN7A7G1_9HEMI|nr:Hypothetical protein NTJ_01012 [Nesidiocoris tenuis]